MPVPSGARRRATATGSSVTAATPQPGTAGGAPSLAQQRCDRAGLELAGEGQATDESACRSVLNAVRSLEVPLISWNEFFSRPAVMAAPDALAGSDGGVTGQEVSVARAADVTLGQVARVLNPLRLKRLDQSVGGERGARLGCPAPGLMQV